MENRKWLAYVLAALTAAVLPSGRGTFQNAASGGMSSVRDGAPGHPELKGRARQAVPVGKKPLPAPPGNPGREITTVLLEPGCGQLVNGRAQIEFRKSFALGVKGCELTAQISPRDRKARGYLYVERLLPDRIVVAESGGGKSDACFDYLVIATQWSFEGR